MPQVIRPSGRDRSWLKVIGAVTTAGIVFIASVPWLPTAAPLPLSAKIILTLALVLGAAGFGLFMAWQLSIGAELTETEIVRRSLFGVKSLPLAQITSASFLKSAGGDVFLTVRASKRRIGFSTYSLSRAQLQQIHDFVAEHAANWSAAGQTAYSPQTPKQAVRFTVVSLLIALVAIAAIVFLGIPHAERRHAQAACQPGAAPTRISPSASSSNCR